LVSSSLCSSHVLLYIGGSLPLPSLRIFLDLLGPGGSLPPRSLRIFLDLLGLLLGPAHAFFNRFLGFLDRGAGLSIRAIRVPLGLVGSLDRVIK
jgi:hypothetical protein